MLQNEELPCDRSRRHRQRYLLHSVADALQRLKGIPIYIRPSHTVQVEEHMLPVLVVNALKAY